MRIFQIKCPSCGATIEAGADRKECYCSYCGNKIHLDDGVKRIEITYVDEARIKEYEFLERMQDKKYVEEKNRSKRSFFITTLCVVAYIVFFGVFFGSEKRESNKQEKELQTIVDAIVVDIENGDFESAYIKAETIYYTAGWSDEIEDKWDATRKELIKQIRNAEKEAKKTEKEGTETKEDKWWNPFD